MLEKCKLFRMVMATLIFSNQLMAMEFFNNFELQRHRDLKEALELKKQKEKAQKKKSKEIIEYLELVYENKMKSMLHDVDHIYFDHFSDLYYSFYIKVISSNCVPCIFLAVGNPLEKNTSPELEKKFNQLLVKLKESKYFVFYDADSLQATIIEKIISSDRRIGISSSKTKINPRYITISNPFLKLELILAFDKIVISPDSILSLALMLEPKNFNTKIYGLDKNDLLQKGLVNWSHSIEVKKESEQESYFKEYFSPKKSVFGLHFTEDRVFNTQILFYYGIHSGLTKVPKLRQFIEDIKNLRPEFIINMHNEAINTKLAYELHQQIKEKKGHDLKTAVLFGSSKGSIEYEEHIENYLNSIFDQGYGIVTGGGGGFMRLANQLALRKNIFSLGIGIGQLRATFLGIGDEARYFEESNSFKIEVQSYSQRIPLLLKDSEKIIFAPGGGGTMKELATLLVQISGDSSYKLQIIFLSEKYYQGLISVLKQLDLPESLFSYIKIQ